MFDTEIKKKLVLYFNKFVTYEIVGHRSRSLPIYLSIIGFNNHIEIKVNILYYQKKIFFFIFMRVPPTAYLWGGNFLTC